VLTHQVLYLLSSNTKPLSTVLGDKSQPRHLACELSAHEAAHDSVCTPVFQVKVCGRSEPFASASLAPIRRGLQAGRLRAAVQQQPALDPQSFVLLRFFCAHRSPYDLACDKKLWAYDAYDSISDALERVEVAPQHKAAALKAIADPVDRALALRSLKSY